MVCTWFLAQNWKKAVNDLNVFEVGWRPDIKDTVLTIYVSVLYFLDILPFYAKLMKAVNETGVFVDGGNLNIYVK